MDMDIQPVHHKLYHNNGIIVQIDRALLPSINELHHRLQ